MTGQELFLAQLKKMKDHQKVVEVDNLEKLQPLIRVFNVPKELYEALNAYYLDYLCSGFQHPNTAGAFHNDDEDIKDGIWSKFFYFYYPIVNVLEKEYPELRFPVYIGPNYKDSTHIVVVAEDRNTYNNILPASLAILFRIQRFFFDFTEDDDPQDIFSEVCTELEEILVEMRSKILRTAQKEVIPIELENKNVEDVYRELYMRLKREDLLPEESFTLAYFSSEPKTLFPEYRWISCFAVTGGEGHYIHIEAINNTTRTLLYLGKTFQGIDFAYSVAHACAKHLGA